VGGVAGNHYLTAFPALAAFPNMAIQANKRKTKLDREHALAETARLARMGYPVRLIGEKLGVSHTQVVYDLKIVKRRYAETVLGSRNELVKERLEQIKDVCWEAVEAYEKSKVPATKVTTESEPERECPVCAGEGWVVRRRKAKPEDVEVGEAESGRRGIRFLPGGTLVEEDKVCFKCDGKGILGGLIKKTEQVEERLPANQFLQTVLDTVKQTRDLLGLDAPKKVDMRAAVAQVPWEAMCLDLPPAAVPDPAEAAIRAVLEGGTTAALPELNGEIEVVPARPTV